MKLNLNAKRAARAAQRGEGMQLELADQTFDLVDELPIEIGDLANDNKLGEAFRLMLRYPDRDWDRLKACRPSFNDVLDVVEFFGTQLGESLRSTAPSPSTGAPSRPTSTVTTGETSQKLSSDLEDSVYAS